MPRQTGRCQIISTLGEQVPAFTPYPLLPKDPALTIDDSVAELRAGALAALRLAVAGGIVPNTEWFAYELSARNSQIEGTQATLPDIVTYEATDRTERPHDLEEGCDYRRKR